MVGIVVVSHSDTLARGVVALAREMSPPELKLEAAGGIGEPDVLGTNAELVREAIQRVMSSDGVLVLMDLGSALMSAELAVELLEEASGPVHLSDAPLVEGTVAAAVAAATGAPLEQVAAEARAALAMKAAQIGADDSEPAPAAAPATARSPGIAGPAAGIEVELLVGNEVGLHARPAARFVETVAAYDAEVLVAKVGSGRQPVSARSLTNVVALGARHGDTVVVSSSGRQAQEVTAALRVLASQGFGDGLPAPEPGAVLSGVAASGGIAVGPARRLERVRAVPSQREAVGDGAELSLFEHARASVRIALIRDRDQLLASGRADVAGIFDAHAMLLDDEALLKPVRDAIAGGATAELAISEAAEQVAAVYKGLDDSLLAERATDVLDVAHRLIAALGPTGAAEVAAGDAGAAEVATGPAGETDEGSPPQILVADELVPSQTIRLSNETIAGIATARGSTTAHAAIIARALGIPAVVGLGESILAVLDGTQLLVDGGAGQVTVAPPSDQVTAAGDRGAHERHRVAFAQRRAQEPLELADGERIEVFANIGGVDDARLAVEFGAEGVGLLRTEFLYLERPALPSEEEQADTLREIAEILEGRPLVVRTLDAGADKPLPALTMANEANPFLGVRGIRLGLRNTELLATQLRAIVRVSAEFPLKVMLPMIATLGEFEAARKLFDQACADTGIGKRPDLGIMAEVPAAALTASELATRVDFFSLGTNDLTQYTMAAERGNAALEPLLGEPQPAVLRLVQETVRAAATHGQWVGVCGEMAGDPAAAALLVGLGVSELSMSPRLIPEAKQALRGLDLGQARAAAERALRAASAGAAREHGLELLGRGNSRASE